MNRLEHDFIQLYSDRRFLVDNNLFIRVRVNSRLNQVFSISLEKLTECLHVVAQGVAEAIWVDFDLHAGLDNIKDIVPPLFMQKVTHGYLMKTLESKDLWGEMFTPDKIHRLPSWIKHCTVCLGSEPSIAAGMYTECLEQVEPFVDLCIEKGMYETAVYMAACVPDWELVGRVVRLGTSDFEDEQYSSRLLLFLMGKAPWKVVVDIFSHHFDQDKFSALNFRNFLFSETNLSDLAERCQAKGLTKWTPFFYSHARLWSRVKKLSEDCEDKDTIDLTILASMVMHRWDMVRHLLNRSSREPMFLLKIFQMAVDQGQPDMAWEMFPFVDLRQLGVFVKNPVYFFLNSAVSLFSSKASEKLLGLAVDAGLTTHVEIDATDLFLHTVFQKKHMLSYLLWKLGVVSTRQCRLVAEDPEVEPVLNTDRQVREVVQETTQVRTLQEMSRLRVCHLLGYHPGRADRIQQLSLTEPARKLVKFEDFFVEEA